MRANDKHLADFAIFRCDVLLLLCGGRRYDMRPAIFDALVPDSLTERLNMLD